MNKKDILIGLLEDDAKKVNQSVSLSSLEGTVVTVTGATGLVGFNIICALAYFNEHFAKNYIHINALSYKKPTGIMRDIFIEKKVVSIFGDLGDSNYIKDIPVSDSIIHSAGYAQPGKFLDDKIKTISINTSATIDLSKRLKKGGRFLFLSSSELYSGSSINKNTESDIGNTDPGHPRSCYIEGKRAGESIINVLREKGLRAVSARLALAYGPGVKDGDKRVLNQFIEQGISGEINLLDSGDALRTYGYISDVVTMLLNILTNNNQPVYNVGGKSTISIKDLALKIGGLMTASVNIPDSNSFMDDAPKTVGLDLTLIESEYGHNEYIDIDYGLAKTIEWITAYNEEKDSRGSDN